MPESFLGDGLIFEELLPLSWDAGPLPQGLSLARMNSDNQQLLGAEASLNDVRIHEALKDESPALLHELQRLEFKLNVLLRLTAELATHHSALPQAQAARLSSSGLEWMGNNTLPLGATGVLSAYINPALPQPLKVACTVAGERFDGDQRVAQLTFNGLSDAVVDLLEKLIFRQHRRLVAGARLASS